MHHYVIAAGKVLQFLTGLLQIFTLLTTKNFRALFKISLVKAMSLKIPSIDIIIVIVIHNYRIRLFDCYC